MALSRSLKGFLPGISFAMAKRAAPKSIEGTVLPAKELDLPRVDLLTHHANKTLLFLEIGTTLEGPSGNLLDKMIDAMGVKKDLTLVSNLGDHPLSETMPGKVIVTLGEEAAQALLKSNLPLSALRAKVHFLASGQKLVATYHPQFLIQNPQAKKEAWEDLKLAMRELNIS